MFPFNVSGKLPAGAGAPLVSGVSVTLPLIVIGAAIVAAVVLALPTLLVPISVIGQVTAPVTAKNCSGMLASMMNDPLVPGVLVVVSIDRKPLVTSIVFGPTPLFLTDTPT